MTIGGSAALETPGAKIERLDTYYLLCFFSGLAITGMEMTISRILAPYFGTSLLVWSMIIGAIMLAMAIGGRFGGGLADRDPRLETLLKILFWAAVGASVIPIVAHPLFQLSHQALLSQAPTLILFLVLLIAMFCLPMVFFAMVFPFIFKLADDRAEKRGSLAGKINGIISLGSLVGLYLPALVTIPLFGSRFSLLFFAGILLFLCAANLNTPFHSGFTLVLLAFSLFAYPRGVVQGPFVLYETESPYHYIQVHRRQVAGSPEQNVTQLILNEGNATHSIHYAGRRWVFGVWDYFSTLPFLAKTGSTQWDALIIGLAAGTISNQLQEPDLGLGSLAIDGVEIDPKIPDVARRFFALNEKNLKVHVLDGRMFLQRSIKKYDFVICDAYKQPYIPFHLTTREFFALVKSHLKPGGLMAINVGSVREDERVVRLIYNTLLANFRHLGRIQIDNPGGPFRNFMVIASDFPITLESFKSLPTPLFADHLDYIQTHFRQIDPIPGADLLTDDHAPVELLTEAMIFGVILDIVKGYLGMK